jgi:hypothetical protein
MPKRYWTTVSRYVDGKFVTADVEHPALVEFPDHIKVNPEDRTLKPVDEGAPAPAIERPLPPYAKIDRGPARVQKPGGRASDVDPGNRG